MFATPQDYFISTLDTTPMSGVEFQAPSMSSRRGLKRKAYENVGSDTSPVTKKARPVLKAKKKRGRTSKKSVSADINKLVNKLKIQQKLENHIKAKKNKSGKKKRSGGKKKSGGKKPCGITSSPPSKSVVKRAAKTKRLANKLNKAIIKRKLANHKAAKKNQTLIDSFPDLIK